KVGVACGDIDQAHARFLEQADELQWLGQVRNTHIILTDTPPPGIRVSIIDVETDGDLQVGHLLAHAPNYAQQKAGAVLERATIAPRPRVRSQQLGYEITVATLDVHTIETTLARQASGLHVAI